MLRKAYLEITNVCNLDCSFCHKTKREKRFLSDEEFSALTGKIRPHTDYLYFHLMGEPLLHPHFGDFLKKATEEGFKITVATNGFLIKKRADELYDTPPYKVTFSLHSYEANETDISVEEYIEPIIAFCKKAEGLGTICVLRLWNKGGENLLNDSILGMLKNHFSFSENRKGYRLSEKIYLEFADRFIWPDKAADKQEVHFCMGLRDQIGVLSDGTVVPCCLDADGSIPLGNLFCSSLEEIMSSERARAIYNGFSEGRCTEDLCSRCQYATRFN